MQQPERSWPVGSPLGSGLPVAGTMLFEFSISHFNDVIRLTYLIGGQMAFVIVLNKASLGNPSKL